MKSNKSSRLFTDELKRIKDIGVAMGILAILLVFFIFILSHFTYRRAAEKYFNQQAVETLTHTSEHMSEKVLSHLNSWYMELKGVEKVISQRDQGEDMYAYFENIDYSSYSEFDKVGVITDRGRIYFAKDMIVDVSSEPSINECVESGKDYVGRINADELNDSVTFAIPCKSVTYKMQNGEQITGIVGVNGDETISDWLQTSAFGEGGIYVVITDNEGNVIADNNKTIPNDINILDILKNRAKSKDNIAKITSGIESGGTGTLYMTDGAVRFITYYAPIYALENDKEYNNLVKDWRIVVIALESSITGNISRLFDESKIFLYVVLLLFAGVLVFTCLFYQRSKLAECKLRSLDALTGVSNNACFVNDANILLRRNNRDYGVIAFNISKFKFINNEIGHEKGDIVLRTVGTTILKYLKDDELVTHSFADRFMMLVKLRGRTPEETVEYFRTKLSSAEYPDGIKIRFNAGIYRIKPDERDIALPMDCARFVQDKLREKTGEHNGIMIYSQEMLDRQKDEFKFENRASEAIEKGYFKVYYQLKRDIQHNRWCGAEALVRWIDPDLGFISPGAFIPLFEKNGFIKEVDKYVFRCVCRDIDTLIKSGHRVCPVSVNVSRRHLENKNFMKEYEAILLSYDIPHELIEFEITETMVSDNEEVLKEFIRWVHGLGCKCSLDDFGSGYSSFNMVKEFDFDTIKLDREFFYGSNGFDSSSQLIVESLIDLSHKLGKSVISEGIECEEQVDFLRSHRCDAVQGFYFSRPAPMNESLGKLE